MKNTLIHQQPLRRTFSAAVFAAALLTSASAIAGEIKFGQEPLAVEADGKLTAEGRKATVEALDNVPGEDLWVAHVWAKLDNGAAGPLYFEFFQEVAGQNSVVLRHEVGDYGGEKQISVEIELPGRIGFNKERTYTVKAVQVNAKGKDLELARGKIKLIKSGKAPPKAAEDEEDAAEQDEADSLGDEGDEGDTKPAAPTSEAPPPVEPKKGCSVDLDAQDGWSGALILLGIGGLGLRRRRT
jgi:MYXO-CTERM domain-containing protein